MTCNVNAVLRGAKFTEPLDDPGDTLLRFRHNAIHADGWGEGILYHDDIDTMGEETLCQKPVILLVHHLPIPAVEVDERWSGVHAAGIEINPLPLAVAIPQIAFYANFLGEGLCSQCPIRNIAFETLLTDRGHIVIGGIESHPVHAAIEHCKPLRPPN